MSHAAMISEAARSADYQAGFEAAKAIYSRNERVVTHGDLTLDRIDRTLMVAGKMVTLRPSYFTILDVLMRGRLATYEAIASALWPDGGETDEQGVLKVHVCMLRRLLPPGTILTCWGQGYRLAEDVRA